MPDPTPRGRPTAAVAGTDGSASAVVIDLSSRSASSARSAPTDCGQAAPDEQATAEYIAELSSELARMADGQNLAILSYFLDMAAVEARAIASGAPLR